MADVTSVWRRDPCNKVLVLLRFVESLVGNYKT